MLQVSFLHGLGLTPAPVPTNLRTPAVVDGGLGFRVSQN